MMKLKKLRFGLQRESFEVVNTYFFHRYHQGSPHSRHIYRRGKYRSQNSATVQRY